MIKSVLSAKTDTKVLFKYSSLLNFPFSQESKVMTLSMEIRRLGEYAAALLRV